MKRSVIAVPFLISSALCSQVIIGDDVGSIASDQKQSVLVEFAAGQNKGIILPYLTRTPSGPGLVEGTIMLDASDPSNAKVKYYNGQITLNSADGWVDLSSGRGADISSALTIQPSISDITETSGAGVTIGSETTVADGVLVLESSNKAMVLPIVSSTDDLIDPAAGMMVYIDKPDAKRLAVFNGLSWTYWKP